MISWRQPDASGIRKGTAVFHYLVESDDGREIRHGYVSFTNDNGAVLIRPELGPVGSGCTSLVTNPGDDGVLLNYALRLIQNNVRGSITEVWL